MKNSSASTLAQSTGKTGVQSTDLLKVSLQVLEDYTCGAEENCLHTMHKLRSLNWNQADSKEIQAMEHVLNHTALDEFIDLGQGPFALLARFQWFNKHKEYAKAKIEILQLLDWMPRNIFVLEKVSSNFMNLEEYQSAREYLKHLIELSPRSYHYHQSLIQCLFKTKMDIQVIKAYQSYRAQFPHDHQLGDLHLLCGYSLCRLGKYKEATSLLTSIKDREALPSFQEVKRKTLTPEQMATKLKNTENPNNQQKMEMGFSYLFHGYYREALDYFEDLKAKKLAELKAAGQSFLI